VLEAAHPVPFEASWAAEAGMPEREPAKPRDKPVAREQHAARHEESIPSGSPQQAGDAREATVPMTAPLPATSSTTFHEVSEHDEGAESHHRPQRKHRQREDEAGAQAVPLQLVETQAEGQPPAQVAGEELPRRTRPRRRRGVAAESGPLQMVETEREDAPTGEGPTAP
jgi:hypothetical protein